ncbi:outer membrane protein assembly factor BamE [Burkholderia sp. Tr-20390]|uniref:outer membrane protein assembly factor BamE n=1 Tax=Burkholderia sp. Tr-20390 TaxID=2703904 RepID=UPI00198002E8|nr:outer membrane protein assembly factor BamE [Burkholderia sp. Tr-20390]MBN3729433.1 outer membrane protein assembly factor BamE [Burkholderia sp. Tr-20390]
MKRTTTAAILAAVIALAGCASAGNQTLRSASSTEIDQHIIKGKSTKSDVEAYLGAAESVSFTDSGLEIWQYTYAKQTSKAINFVPVVGIFAGGADVDKKVLTILFNDKGVVMKSSYAASKSEIRTGLAN